VTVAPVVPASGPRTSRLPVTLVVGACLGAVALTFAFEDLTRSFWSDEAFSVWIARDGVGHLRDAIRYDAHPPLYYLLLAGWIKLGGTGEVWTRLPSVFCFLASLVITLTAGARTLGRSVARWTAGFQLASISAIQWAHEVRFYALLGAMSTASIILTVALASEDRTSRTGVREALLFAINLAGLFTHYYFGFVVLSLLAGLCWLRRFRLGAIACVAPLISFAALWLPTLRFQLGLQSSYWRTPPTLLDLVHGYATQFGLKRAPLLLVALVVTLADRPTRDAVRSWLAAPPDRRGRLLLPICAVLCVLLPWSVSQVKPLYAYPGLAIATFPIAAVIGLTAAHARWRSVWISVFVLMLAWTALSAFKLHKFNSEPGHGDRATTDALLANSTPGDIVVVTTWVGFDYYLRDKPVTLVNFPPEEAGHPGWYNEPAVLKRGGAGLLRKDALDIVNRARTTRIAGHHPAVWLLDGDDSMFAPETRAIASSVFSTELHQLEPIPVHNLLGLPTYSCWRHYVVSLP
jgi:4-amino-4-deoxy-L-arabinose transferase-like glycosyltransferase